MLRTRRGRLSLQAYCMAFQYVMSFRNPSFAGNNTAIEVGTQRVQHKDSSEDPRLPEGRQSWSASMFLADWTSAFTSRVHLGPLEHRHSNMPTKTANTVHRYVRTSRASAATALSAVLCESATYRAYLLVKHEPFQACELHMLAAVSTR